MFRSWFLFLSQLGVSLRLVIVGPVDERLWFWRRCSAVRAHCPLFAATVPEVAHPRTCRARYGVGPTSEHPEVEYVLVPICKSSAQISAGIRYGGTGEPITSQPMDDVI